MDITSLQRQMLMEGEELRKNYSTQLGAIDQLLNESAAGERLDDFQKTQIARLLENVEIGMATAAHLREDAFGTQSVNIAKKIDYLNLATVVFGTSIIDKVASIQTLKQKYGAAFYVGAEYDSDKGQIKRGDRIGDLYGNWPEDPNKIPSAIRYTSEEVPNEAVVYEAGTGTEQVTTLGWGPVTPTTLKAEDTSGNAITDDGQGSIFVAGNTTAIGTIDYKTKVITFNDSTILPELITYDIDLTTAPLKAPKVRAVVKEIPLQARPRKVEISFSFDAAFDLMATQNYDLKKLSQEIATGEMREEVDGEVLEDLRLSGTTMNVTFNMPVPFGISKDEHWRAFYATVNEAANKIWQKTRKYTGNTLIVGEDSANIVEYDDRFKAAGTLNDPGPHVMGTYGKFLVIKDPYCPTDKFTVEYRGTSNPFETSYVYAPYMPPTATQFLMDSSFLGTQGYGMSYAKKLVSRDFICDGTITYNTTP